MQLHPLEKKALQLLQIQSVQELVSYYPSRYEHFVYEPYERWHKGDDVVFVATICSPAQVKYFKGKQSFTRFQVNVEGVLLHVTLFNRPWTSAFPLGKTLHFKGKYQGHEQVAVSHCQTKAYPQGIVPIYRLKKGVDQDLLRSLIQKALHAYTFEDFVDARLRSKYRLCTKQQALQEIHQPSSMVGLKEALRHLKYEEFFKFQLGMQRRKLLYLQSVRSQGKCFDPSRLNAFVGQLPFSLTSGQQKALQDIVADLQRNQPMHRLLQGDVGCGKTIVGFLACYATILAGEQAIFLAPTQILAQQHYQSMKTLLAPLGLKMGLLTSDTPHAQRTALFESATEGSLQLLVGTHALFHDDLHFAKLGLVVIDEQQRFGVEQRRILKNKGEQVDVLLMSATPIPRTLAFSLFGDMDLSLIEGMPATRKPKTTKLVAGNSMKPILKELKDHLEKGNQIYVVTPAIEENQMGVRNAQSVYEALQKELKNYKIGLVHGKLKSDEKDQVMDQFQKGLKQVLVATSVIEVGIDVANANIMVIYDAHRFGLSQLHQLRGRIGRHDQAGTCYLLSSAQEEEALQRLQVLVESEDGQSIALADLKQRGYGDLLGQRQSGLPQFLLANLVEDAHILEVARQDAQAICGSLANHPHYETYLETFVEYHLD